jgi:magnesium transporter
MAHIIKDRSKKAGLPPGTLIHIGDKKTGKVKITLLDYDENHLTEKELSDVNESAPYKNAPTTTWINVDGLDDTSIIDNLGKIFEFHHLMLEDILNTDQRPKMEDFGSYIFIVLKMLHYDENKKEILTEQVSFIIGPNYVISFQEGIEGDDFKSLRERIRTGKSRIRKMGADYLAYSLMDAIVDNYFVIIEKFGETIEELENQVIMNPTTEVVKKIHHLKREIIFLRKAVYPLREVISCAERDETTIIKKSTKVYLKDVYDHTIQVMDNVETFRDILAGMTEVYVSSISLKLNEVMKVLTVIATIFMPMTFLAGVYGMNFHYFPEISWKYGYLIFWIVIVGMGASMLIYFKKKKWI